MRLVSAALKNFALDDENGGATAMALSLIVVGLMMGGYAIDVSNAVNARTELQITADAAAHAALLAREFKTEAEAKTVALDVAQRNMPEGFYGEVLTDDDIVFGKWDPVARIFTPQPGSRAAVQVRTRQVEERGNSVDTYLLKLVGFDQWDLVTDSVFITYRPTCLKEGIVSDTRVDLQSNNAYRNGFCLHSNGTMELNQNNYFEPGTVVSLSEIDNLELPNSGYDKNEGLTEALREGSWNIRVIERIDDIIAGLYAADPRYVPDYITNTTFKTLPTNVNLTAADFTPGQLHTATCGKNDRLVIARDTVLTRVAVATNCRISYADNVRLEDVVMATTNTAARSVEGNQNIYIGRDDSCAPGGGAQILSMGSMKFTSNLHMYGGQLMAKLNIEFTANANGLQGAAIVAGGTVSGTSNMDMGFCGTGMEDNYHSEYFKLVQ